MGARIGTQSIHALGVSVQGLGSLVKVCYSEGQHRGRV